MDKGSLDCVVDSKKVYRPLYSKLVNQLITKIETMKAGDKLPSERDICRDYAVSRTTVRQALSELELNGFIIRSHGRGTFVAPRNVDKQNLSDYYSFTEQTLQNGMIPKSVILDFHVEVANAYVQEKMNLGENDKVIRFIRLRLASDVPMMLETTFIPYEEFDSITMDQLSKVPLYNIFSEKFDRKIKTVEEQFSAGIVSKEQAQSLQVKPGEACLKITRLSCDANNRVIELTISFARGDKFVYRTTYKTMV